MLTPGNDVNHEKSIAKAVDTVNSLPEYNGSEFGISSLVVSMMMSSRIISELSKSVSDSESESDDTAVLVGIDREELVEFESELSESESTEKGSKITGCIKEFIIIKYTAVHVHVHVN